MKSTRFFRTTCNSCGGAIQYPAEQVGTSIPCPHCGESTELLLEAPPEESVLPRRMVILGTIAVVILAGGLLASMYALKQARGMAERSRNRPEVAPSAPNAPLAITNRIDNTWGVSQAHLRTAAGRDVRFQVSVTNLLTRPRAGVTAQIELLDSGGRRVGVVQEQLSLLSALGEWSFHITNPPAAPVAGARVISVTEK
jgi:hypothetical protein